MKDNKDFNKQQDPKQRQDQRQDQINKKGPDDLMRKPGQFDKSTQKPLKKDDWGKGGQAGK